MSIYHTPKWKSLRRQALRRDNFQCVACSACLKGKGKSRVDHILTVQDRPDLAFTLSNLRCLCPSCDNKRHAEKSMKGPDIRQVGSDGFPMSPDHPWNKTGI